MFEEFVVKVEVEIVVEYWVELVCYEQVEVVVGCFEEVEYCEQVEMIDDQVVYVEGLNKVQVVKVLENEGLGICFDNVNYVEGSDYKYCDRYLVDEVGELLHYEEEEVIVVKGDVVFGIDEVQVK